MSKTYVRIDHRHADVVNFLIINNYPIYWDVETLSQTIVARLFNDEDDTVGVVWSHWVDTGIMVFHVCIARAHRIRWIDPDLFQQLFQMAFWLGADEVATSLDNVPHAPQIKRWLLSLGFEEAAPAYGKETLLTKNLWNPYGRSIQNPEAANPGTASASTGRGTD